MMAGAERPRATNPTAMLSSANGSDPSRSSPAIWSHVPMSVSNSPIAKAVRLIAA